MTSFDLEAGLPERTFFAFGAGRVAFRDTGLRSDCPPLLLVHGLGSSSLTWTRLVARLPSDRRIILVDLPGFGKSDAVDPVSLGGFGDAIVALLTQLEVERAVWIGHSMGGQVSILQALAQPALFERLFLIAPAGLERFSSQEGRLLRAAVTTSGIKRQRRKDVAANVRLAFDRWVPEAEALVDARMAIVGEELDRYAATFKASVHAMLDEPIHDRWPELRVPTAVLFGAADRLIPNRLLHPRLTTKRLAESSRRRLPGTLTMVAGAGHMVHFERPAPVAQAIEAFIAAPATLDAAG